MAPILVQASVVKRKTAISMDDWRSRTSSNGGAAKRCVIGDIGIGTKVGATAQSGVAGESPNHRWSRLDPKWAFSATSASDGS